MNLTSFASRYRVHRTQRATRPPLVPIDVVRAQMKRIAAFHAGTRITTEAASRWIETRPGGLRGTA